MQTKTQIRTAKKRQRRNLNLKKAETLNQKIFQRGVDVIKWENIKTLHLYLPIPTFNEVDTIPFLKHVQSNYPAVNIYASLIHQIVKDTPPPDVLKQNRVVFPLEKRGAVLNSQIPIDLFLVPLVAFDIRGYRLGHGGGFYDILLNYFPKAQKIGLAYEFQRVNKIPEEAHDIRLDKIVTEKQTYQIQSQ